MRRLHERPEGAVTIQLRKYRAEDAPALFEAVQESVEEMQLWVPWCSEDYSLETARWWIGFQEEARQKKTEYSFAVVDEFDRLLGGCGLNEVHAIHRCANLGYWVRTSEAGKGIATTAVQLLTDWAFSETQLERLEILAAADNKASLRVAEKAGAKCEGLRRSRLRLCGRMHDGVGYSFIRPWD